MIELNTNPPPQELRLFSILLIVFGLVGSWVLKSHFGAPPAATWTFLTFCLSIGIIGACYPPAVRWVFVSWMIIAFPIGWTVSHLILALIFYGVFTPFGWIARSCGYDPLQTRRSGNLSSYWQALESMDDLDTRQQKERYFRQF